MNVVPLKNSDGLPLVTTLHSIAHWNSVLSVSMPPPPAAPGAVDYICPCNTVLLSLSPVPQKWSLEFTSLQPLVN